jgi:anaerobic magnesium-protoporphyrin IX monomethyl ester cyclase
LDDSARKKLLLVNVIDDAESFEFDPLGLGYLAAVARRRHPHLTVRILNTGDPAAVFGENADLIGFSCSTRFFGIARALAEESVARGIPTLLGGPHVTLLPATLPAGVTGVMGDGELTFLDLLERFFEHGRLRPEDLPGIPGLALRDGEGRVALTPRRPPIAELDTLPMPDRDLLNIQSNGRVDLFSSRGCPYSCTFCAAARMFPGIRFFSADYVVREIKYLIERYRPVHIKFFDDLFIASRPRLREIVGKIRAEGIHKKVIFNVNATASLIDEESVDLLRKMNVFTVRMGLETGNQQTLDYLKAGKASVERNERAVRLLAKKGLNPEASFIIGSPGETPERFDDTIDLVARTPLTRAELFLLSPLPGTPVWEMAEKRGLVGMDMDWSILSVPDSDELGSRIILADAMTVEQIKDGFRRFRALARRKFRQRMLLQGLKRPGLLVPFARLQLRRLAG